MKKSTRGFFLLLAVVCLFSFVPFHSKASPTDTVTTVYFDSVTIPAHGMEYIACPLSTDAATPSELPQGVSFCVVGDVVRLYNTTASSVTTGEMRFRLIKFN